MDEQVLLANLIKSDILGLDSIIANMPEIYQRFVLNRGKNEYLDSGGDYSLGLRPDYWQHIVVKTNV